MTPNALRSKARPGKTARGTSFLAAMAAWLALSTPSLAQTGATGAGSRTNAPAPTRDDVRAVAPATLLEVGVGTGLTLAQYPAETAVTGIDLSPEMLRHAEQRAAALPGRQIALLLNAESSAQAGPGRAAPAA